MQTTATTTTTTSTLPTYPTSLKYLGGVRTRHGNAAHMIWTDDSKQIYLANQEGVMSACKLDVADLNRPRLAVGRQTMQYCWAVDFRGGVLVYRATLGWGLQRLDPVTLNVIWTQKVNDGHSVATDGTRVFCAIPGAPGYLSIRRASDGTESARLTSPEPWGRMYVTEWDAANGRLYIGAEADSKTGALGGVYIYGNDGASLKRLGKISGQTGNLAVSGTRMWRTQGGTIECWNVSNPAAPGRTGVYVGTGATDTAGRSVPISFADLCVNRAGTRAYVLYNHGGRYVDLPRGVMIFDISGSTPRLLATQAWKTDIGYYMLPLIVSLSKDERTISVSYWTYGMRLFSVVGDTFANLGSIPTTGEARDVVVDAEGHIHTFVVDMIQSFEPVSGELVGSYVTMERMEGRWAKFRDGTIITPGHTRRVYRFSAGKVQLVGSVGNVGTGSQTWSEVFEEPYLYSGTEKGLWINKVGPLDTVKKWFGQTRISNVDPGSTTSTTGARLMWIVKDGHIVWGVGPNCGVVAMDVSDPASPRVVMRDPFTFFQNGNAIGITVARGRVYAGCGDRGVVIYDAARFRRTGQIGAYVGEYVVNYVDKIGEDILFFTNYWYPKTKEGVWLFDLRQNPDAPRLIGNFPNDLPRGTAGFRARPHGNRVLFVPLYGVDVVTPI
jgi:hypothetical protein